MTLDTAVHVTSLTHRYGSRVALDDVAFSIDSGDIFAFLGPNGGGKTTLFRILSTLMPSQIGDVRVFGYSTQTDLFHVRRRIGVAFQSLSLDRKLTVDENISAQAALYGLSRPTLNKRRDELLLQLGIADRRRDQVETLSGGLQRRADLAKALIHQPPLLLLDEPTAGLDPGARSDLWQYLKRLREQFGTTIVLTSHILEEADRADQVGILHEGRLVAVGDPGSLRAELGGNSITIETNDAESLCRQMRERWQCPVTVVDGDVRVSGQSDSRWAAQLVTEFPHEIKSVKIGRPTLEDVFVEKTGHRFWQDERRAADRE